MKISDIADAIASLEKSAGLNPTNWFQIYQAFQGQQSFENFCASKKE